MTPVSIRVGTTARLKVNLAALVANYRTLARAAGTAECGGVVKADAYGLGLEPVAKALWDAGCRTFFVALLSEAIELRGYLGEAVIYVLNGLMPNSAVDYDSFGVRPILGSLEEIGEWSAYCRTTGKRLEAAIHIDTGINRLGLEYDESCSLLKSSDALADFNISFLMSHLACADEPSHPLNQEQVDKCHALRALMPGVPFSLANSAGILGSPSTHFDLVRPGISLYGGNAMAEPGRALEQVMTLEATVLRVRHVAEGQSIGYGSTFTCKRPTKIAVLGLGYADGYFRSLSGTSNDIHAYASIDGQKVPIVGRISMDMIGIDVTDVPEEKMGRGTFVELINNSLRLDDVAQAGGSFSYELLTRMGNRFTRVYSNE